MLLAFHLVPPISLFPFVTMATMTSNSPAVAIIPIMAVIELSGIRHTRGECHHDDLVLTYPCVSMEKLTQAK